jgi:uncharacterized protein (TIGR00369 family)
MDLEDDQMCFCCGKKNEDGLQLNFELVEERKIKTQYTFPKKFQGFKDIVHGGIIATVLDEVMVNLAYRLGIVAVTASIEVRLKRPAKVGQTITFYGQVGDSEKRLVEASGQAYDAQGALIAEATAKLMKV